MKTKLDHALNLASMGFHVFPIVPNTKIPPKDFHFKEKATTDTKTITHWWTNGYSDYNIGIFTEKFKESEALLVVDVDQKEGKMGESEILRLELEGLELETTLEQRTPSGGRHLIYSVSEPVKQGVNVLGHGIDIRSKGGYIVGPGSTLPNGTYVLGDGKIVRASKVLVLRCGTPNVAPIKRDEHGVIAATGESRARSYLATAPIAEQGNAGDQTTFTVAAKCKDFGLEVNRTMELMSELWNPNCEPPWNETDLLNKIQNAYRYGQNSVGNNSPENDFTVIEPQDTELIAKFKEKMFHEIRPDFNQTYLVENMLSHKAMSVVYGESNSGKTFFALDLALHVALGQPFHTLAVEPGAVIYVAAEGGFGIKKRIEAFRQYHKLENADIPFALIDVSVDLKKDAKALIETIKRVETRSGIKAHLIVIDTLARTLGEGNENEAKDMGAFIKAADAIRLHSDAHIMVIHHTGKDAAKGARGHSSLRGATDTEILIEDNCAKTRKQRDMEFGNDIGFKLQSVVIGRDVKGKAITSCVVLPSNAGAVSDFSREPLDPGSLIDKAHKAILATMEWASIPAPNDLGLAPDKVVAMLSDIKDSYNDLYPDIKRTTNAMALTRGLAALSKLNYIHKNDVYVWLK